MWQKKKIKLPYQALDILTGKSNSDLSLSVKGQKIAVHNWTHGKQEQSGRYLSPENAVKVVAKKFTDYADPNRPQGQMQVVCFLATSSGQKDFIEQLERMSGILDYSEVKQALSYAKAYAELENTKMVKMPMISSPAFATDADLTPSIARKVSNAVSHGKNSSSISDPFDIINQLKAKKQAKEQAKVEEVKKLVGNEVTIWAFAGEGLLDYISLELQKNLPTAENIYSFLLVFIGENLTGLTGLLNEVDE
ncbi:hypothetical protein OF381_10555 [Mannheimia haemolytica]